MIKQKQNIHENPQENIPNKKPELPKDFEKIQKEKMEIINKTEWYKNFLKSWEVEKLSQEEIQKFIEILNTISIDDLNNYILRNLWWVIFSSKDEIIEFINNNKLDNNINNKLNSNNTEINDKLVKLLEEYEKQNPNSLTFEEKNILDNLSFKNWFQNKDKDNNTLKSFFQNKEKTKELFDKILEKPQNKELYEVIYKNAISIDPEAENRFKEWWYDINWKVTEEIPKNLGKIDSINEEVYFPDRTSSLKRYGDWSITSTISTWFMDNLNIKITPNWKSEVNKYSYTLKPNINFPETKDLKIKYNKERLDTIDRININNKLLDLLNNKENLSKNLEELKSQKTWEWQNANDLIIDIEINNILKEIQKIEEILIQAIPWYIPEQDNWLKTFLNIKLQDDKKNLIVLKENFLKEKAGIYANHQNEIKTEYKKANETLEFLNNIWLTYIPQNELQKIINIINQNPSNYNFDEKINLNNWLESKTLDAKSQKKQLTERMSEIYKKTWENINIEALIQWKTNPYINDPTKFMWWLEKAWIFKHWIFQLGAFKELFLWLNK